ncbi:hypothetical protein A2526_00245 [candidate division WOR-1 bacterium RIFOXYD2_FULL_36_8]|uniref:Uncharacterized protein n=1 Tax=candidate division WOR-1 bacterium RIFOXYB2_FULL_36_35 TaxID=1802578 RepID=A0A1F4S686_UNCSA|nr:MAG: hypothetical protein A2230_00945 [candidate division WOR-1 bacterium RIFOXYA2_FULL_36_21]OGC14248.1 MAG: hypothetical protein A2282_06660 [candidate division WOR-1 bacterium RIFOXYA12_FULL_36_13]OGC15253.1 MAG: hypothetical protein A2290_03155 [candidate division WOR-1 bacterium RIFOXYB2_FULL_36_35]OGC38263.1 MAG: hypothetical protein A2526_00245 [candidate division WOR-1 bacterium RIFOXYD2_FULL_36_8]
MKNLENKNPILCATAYLFFMPTLYIILTDRRKNKYNAFHASFALILWMVLITIFMLIRAINMLAIASLQTNFASLLLWAVTIPFSLFAFFDKTIEIPIFSKIAGFLA